MPQIIPIKDLRNTTEISRKCHETNEPIFVTKNGYGDMVLMSMATYERDIARTELLYKIAEGEEDLKNGNVIEAESALKDLRKEFFD
ncbi:type II toxin-antitoxin system Phd/YefM family antitoxin [Thiospirochaeta perfilievii]|uniref:Antitoxin n=1 Tax=Thiospirochaeta perfilievii TaxID=252967 RepID=A0A5C1Q900_9SPIO|nr:type II toxin-antitoxin system Phd/YefM family antitoxin [Thiospirochaeta perfilievii]QEN03356.1 type II toxin-antitoxin system Phd/YefM family antitoxin [Thiospirochaeta perfilievii]